MKLILTLFSLLIIIFNTNAQDSRLEYCKHEVGQLEKKVETLNKLMLSQSTEVFELKKEIIVLRQKNQVLDQQNAQLNDVAINMINIAIKFEQEKKYTEAMEIYKLLIKSYPSSLEAASSRIQIKDLRNNINK